MNDDLKARIATFLQSQQLCTFATLDSDGFPMVHTIHFQTIGLNIYLSSKSDTAKVVHARANPHCAYSVYNGSHEPTGVKAIHVQGLAEVLTAGAEADEALALHKAAFPWASWPGAGENAIVRVAPVFIAFRDHSKGVGNIDKVRL